MASINESSAKTSNLPVFHGAYKGAGVNGSPMKTLRRLELISGLIYFVSIVLVIYFIDLPLEKGVAELHNNSNWSYWDDPFISILVLLHP